MARKIPPTRYPHGVELDYYHYLRRLIRAWFAELLDSIRTTANILAAGLRMDGPFDGLFDWAREAWNRLADAVLPQLTRFAGQVNGITERSFSSQVEAGLSGRVSPQMARNFGVSLASDAGLFGDLQEQVNQFTRENVRLIRSIGTQATDNIERAVQQAVATGGRTADLAGIVQQELATTERRAATIARDQIGKLNGNLNRVRQQSAGVERYRWQTMQDKRVRPTHQALNGEERTWSQSPRPGEEILCRCVPAPIFSDADFGI